MRALKVENNVVTQVIKVDSVPEGWVEDPSKTGIGYIDNGDGTFSPPAENVYVPSAKETRDAALQALEYDFGDGRIMQTRPQDEQNIRNAIEIMLAAPLTTIDWVMKDNTKQAVSVTDLQTALSAGQQAGLAIWNAYTPD